MEILKHLRDPVYMLRPWQIAKRMRFLLYPPKGDVEAPLPWGDILKVRTDEKNGQTILERGLDQLIVVEACLRLMEPGSVGVDVGANYGQMTVALAHAAKSTGTVYAFEPHPGLFKYLRKNTEEKSAVRPVRKALSEHAGKSYLHVPKQWQTLAGSSSLNSGFVEGTEKVEVVVSTLDKEIGNSEEVSVMKVDVEGHEREVMKGGIKMFSERRVKHVVFEDHDYESSKVVDFLKEMGYEIYSIESRLSGPVLTSPDVDDWNFVATLSERECQNHFDSGGWRALGK
jgi:FkbM family methyltransferase